jgi:PAS domain S-box-containing protein
MFSIDPDGLLLEANPRWFEMTGHSRNVIYSMSWMETIHENSISVVKEAWTRLTVAQISWVGELV